MPSIGVSQIGLGLGQHQDYLWANAFSRPLMDDVSAHFDRNGSATVFDWEGLINSMAAHVTRQQGLRVVENLLNVTSEVFTDAAWAKSSGGTGSVAVVTPGQTDPEGGVTAYRLQLDRGAGGAVADYSFLRNDAGAVLIATDITVVQSIWIRSNTGSSQVVAFSYNDSAASDVTVTTSWRRMSVEPSSNAPKRYFTLNTQGNGAQDEVVDVLIWRAQHEDVTGQAITAPNEYRSIGVVEGPEIIIAQAAAQWAVVGTNTVADVADGSVLITYVDSAAGAQLIFKAAAGVVANDSIVGRTYVVSGEAKVGAGDEVEVKTADNTASGGNITSTSYVPFSITVEATSGTTFRFQMNGMFTGETINIRNVSLRLATTGHAVKETLNGITVTDNIVDESVEGLSLHPRKKFRLPGYRTAERFLRPDIIKDSQDYEVGDIVHTSAQIFPGCGNGFYYEVTTAGTTDGSVTGESDSWTETIGGTASNNGVVFTNRGHLKYSGMLFEPGVSDQKILQTEDQGTTWGNSWNGGVTLTLNDAVAPDGRMTMDKLTGVDNASDGNNQTVTLGAAIVYFISLYIKTDDSAQNSLLVFDDNVAAALSRVTTDWAAGIPSTSASAGASFIRYDRVPGTDIYRLSFKFTTAGTVTTHRIVIEPDKNNAQKSIYVWGINITPDLLTSYIAATTTAQSRVTEADSLQYTIAQIMHRDVEGYFSVDWVPNVDKADLDVIGAVQRLWSLLSGLSRGVAIKNTSEQFLLSDGTNTPQRTDWASKHIAYRLAGRWNTALNELELFLNGTTSGVVSYDGSFDDDGFLHFFENITQLINWMSNFEYGKKDPGSAALLTHTAYDQAAA